MALEIPALRQIRIDPERSAREIQVHAALVELLDLVDQRVVSLTAIQSKLSLMQRAEGYPDAPLPTSTISTALNALCQSGYLARETMGNGTARYRLLLSRVVVARKRAVRSKSATRLIGVVSEAIGDN